MIQPLPQAVDTQFYVEADVKEEYIDTIIVAYGNYSIGYRQDTLIHDWTTNTWLKCEDSVGLLER